MSVFAGPAKAKKEYPLTPKGIYVATLLDLTYETGGTYGDSLLWKWLLAPQNDPTNYIARDDGMEKSFHEYSPPEIIMGSKSHEWIAALTGQVLADGDEPPDSDDLIGKRMIVHLGHAAPRQGPNAGKLRERLTQGTAEAWSGPPMKVARNVTPSSRPSAQQTPVQVSADPSDDEMARLTLAGDIEKKIAKLRKLDAGSADQAQAAVEASDLGAAPLSDLQVLLNQIEQAIAAALDD